MKTVIFIGYALIFAVLLSFSSCEIAGLPLQTDYQYEYATLNPEIGITTYEFIKKRSTVDMTLFYFAIKKAEMKEEFEKPGRTYLLLNDVGCNRFFHNKKITFQGMSKYDLQQWLNQFIVEGVYSSLDLTLSPQIVKTLPSIYFNQSGTLPPKVRFLSLDPVFSQNMNNYRVLIDFAGLIYERDILKCASLETNIIPSNGGVIHIFDKYPEYYPKDVNHPEIP
jgi:hypothetical protein